MKKIRLSHTLMSAWEWGRYEDIVPIYLRLDQDIPKDRLELMQQGKVFDELIEQYVRQNLELPKSLGSMKVPKAQPKIKLEVEFDESFDVSGELDILADNFFIEIKHSRTHDSVYYSETGQLDMYMLLCALSNIDVKYGMVFRYDPIKRTYDSSVMHNTSWRIERAQKRIETVGPAIYNHLQLQGVI